MADTIPPTGTPDPKVPDPTPVVSKKGAICPACGGPLTVYTGTNDLKVGTGFCDICGARYPLKG